MRDFWKRTSQMIQCTPEKQRECVLHPTPLKFSAPTPSHLSKQTQFFHLDAPLLFLQQPATIVYQIPAASHFVRSMLFESPESEIRIFCVSSSCNWRSKSVQSVSSSSITWQFSRIAFRFCSNSWTAAWNRLWTQALIPLWLTCQVCYIGSKSTSLSTPIGVKVTCFLAFYAFETIPAFIKSCISCRFGITFNAPFLVVISDAPAFAKYSNSRSCSFVSLSASCSNT